MSFLSVEPQSRAVLESHSNSLLAQFTIQLRIIVERYLAFFQERRRIEATYVDSLRKLHRKANTIDASFDPRAEPTTTRAAWDTVRDDLKRAVAEASTQQAFVDILDNDVIKPLRTLKVSQKHLVRKGVPVLTIRVWKETKDETRKRIEEDLKGTAAKYADYAENTISKLQRAYLKKYYPQQCAHSTDASQCPQDIPNKRFGGRVSALFRSRREDSRDPEPTKSGSEEVSDDDYRRAVGRLHTLRLIRAENLGEGYDCLEELVFTTTIKEVLVKYMNGMIAACVKYDDLAMSTRAEVVKALAGTDTSGLMASFRRALSFSIPPSTLYRNSYPSAYSDLIFGVPLVDLETNQDNIPKVIKLCIEEVEKRGLDTKKIYSLGSIHDAEVLELRRRFECEKSFSFGSTDTIHSVAMLLKRYLRDLPEPMFMLSMQDYRQYRQNRVRYAPHDLSLLRSKIGELHPVHRAALEAVLLHFLRVASHSAQNAMTVEALAAQFCYTILRGNAVLRDGVHVKHLVLEDLIRNAHTLFEQPSTSPIPPPYVTKTTSTLTMTYGSCLSPELPQPAEVQATGSTTRHLPGLMGGIPTFIQSSLPSGTAMEGHLTPSPTPLLSPLLELPSSTILTEAVETTTQEQVVLEVRGAEMVETFLDSSPPKVVPPTSVAEWRLHQSQLPPHPEPLTVPQSSLDSVSSNGIVLFDHRPDELKQPPLAIILIARPLAPRTVLPLLPPPIKLGFPLFFFTLRLCHGSSFQEAWVCGSGRSAGESCMRRAWTPTQRGRLALSPTGGSLREAGTVVVCLLGLVVLSRVKSPGYSTGPGARDDSGENNLSPLEFQGGASARRLTLYMGLPRWETRRSEVSKGARWCRTLEDAENEGNWAVQSSDALRESTKIDLA
ncbi:hypothetical protein EDB86DRAFT_3243261 [Lactarius hatsudake]|nr:hypothetical protein EDB86DRAFT_3243261 [Lactarius hatsudake]